MFHDLVGTTLAIALFVVVCVTPGYALSWVLDLLQFRERSPGIRIIFATVISNAVVPVGLFWFCRFSAMSVGVAALLALALAAGAIALAERVKSSDESRSFGIEGGNIRSIWPIAVAWSVLATLLLVDLQVGHRLYFSAVAYDYTTRVAVIDAITRSGVPPANPGYFPGTVTPLTFLYYFWYLLGSAVDTIGGSLVSPYNAMIASVAWCGLLVMATIVAYLHLRSELTGRTRDPKASLALSLFLVSGLDFIPVVLIMWQSRRLFGHIPFGGRIEGWNMPVMSWVNAVTWVPNHVAGAMACIAGLLLVADGRPRSMRTRRRQAIVAGLAFASALGLSVWLPLVFAPVWLIWMLRLSLDKNTRSRAGDLLLAGLVSVAAAAPFIFDVLGPAHAAGVGAAVHPVELFIRPFTLVSVLGLHGVGEALVNFLLLPVNYLFELGIFFIIALIWLRRTHVRRIRPDSVEFVEIVVVLVVLLVTSFVRSTLIALNDLGMRAWLLAQFVLVIWAADLVAETSDAPIVTPRSVATLTHGRLSRAILAGMVVVGLLTTSLEIVAVRFWAPLVDAGIVGFPNELSPDTHLGERTYDAREAYSFVNTEVPPDVVVQANPIIVLDRPAGLYSRSQWAISDRTPYGVPADALAAARANIGRIFEDELSGWPGVDGTCKRFSIGVLVIRDTDPVWRDRKMTEGRRPLFHNQHYAVYACGAFDGRVTYLLNPRLSEGPVTDERRDHNSREAPWSPGGAR